MHDVMRGIAPPQLDKSFFHRQRFFRGTSNGDGGLLRST